MSEAAASQPRRRAAPAYLRPVLMAGGIGLALFIGVRLWLAMGAGFSTDDAYIRAPKLALASDVSGIVQQVFVHEGEKVAQGQLLLALDPLPFRIAADEAEAALAGARLEVIAAKRDYARALREIAAAEARVAADSADEARFTALIGAGGVTKAELDGSHFKHSADQAGLDAARAGADMLLAKLGGNPDIDPDRLPSVALAAAKRAEAERQLTHTKLFAPFAGWVTNVDSVQKGQYLAASTPALALVGSDSLWVEAFPKETDLAWAEPHDPVSVRVDTYPDRRFDGEIESISPVSASAFSVLPAQNASGNWVKVVQRIPLRIRLTLHPGDPPLRDGMSAVIEAVSPHHRRTLGDLLP